MKNMLLEFIYNLNYHFLMKNVILLESNPDFCDNTKGFYDELIRRKLNEKYKIIWFLVNDTVSYNDIKDKNVRFILRNKNLICKFRFAYYNFFSKYIIDCNNRIHKRNKNQLRIYLTHGTPLKMTWNYCKSVGKFDYLIQISDYFTEAQKKLYNISDSQILTTGFPRNDILLSNNNTYFSFLKNEKSKIVLWFPTYRIHKSHAKEKQGFKYGVPSIENDKQLNILNDFLAKKSIKLYIKLHPAENIKGIEKMSLSNINLLYDTIFNDNHTNLYQLLPYANALITDYSSVYYDFLLLNRPIGLAISDILEYKKENELYFDLEKNLAGEFIYNFNDLLNFFDNLSKNKDVSKKDRQNALKKYHKYVDNKSASRIVDILEKHMTGELK